MKNVWKAVLTDEEEKRADAEILFKLREELEYIWKELKEEFLKEGG